MLEQVETLQCALSGVREQLLVIHDATARLTAMVNAIELVRIILTTRTMLRLPCQK